MARPEKPIDWDLLDSLLEAGCSSNEAAPYFNMTGETICYRVLYKYGMDFSSYSREKTYKGDACIRHQQYLKATGQSDKGDNTQLVWLGKNRLKQRDAPQELTVTQLQVDTNIAIMSQLTKAQEEAKDE